MNKEDLVVGVLRPVLACVRQVRSRGKVEATEFMRGLLVSWQKSILGLDWTREERVRSLCLVVPGRAGCLHGSHWQD